MTRPTKPSDPIEAHIQGLRNDIESAQSLRAGVVHEREYRIALSDSELRRIDNQIAEHEAVIAALEKS
jgi:hypothetical protein